MESKRENYYGERAVIIQSFVQSKLARWRFLRLRKACVFIQARLLVLSEVAQQTKCANALEREMKDIREEHEAEIRQLEIEDKGALSAKDDLGNKKSRKNRLL
jgi:hypothetical protein